MHILAVVGLALIVAITGAVGSGTNGIALAATCVFFPAAIALYFSPAVIARLRHHPNTTAIFVLDLVLGWTLIGWVGALVWAHTKQVIVDSQDSLRKGKDAAINETARTDGQAAIPTSKCCPFCAEDIKLEAIRCKHCGSDLAMTGPLSNPTHVPLTAPNEQERLSVASLDTSAREPVSLEEPMPSPADPESRWFIVTWALGGLSAVAVLAALAFSFVSLNNVKADTAQSGAASAEDAVALNTRKQECAHAVFEREYHPAERASYDAAIQEKCANFEIHGKAIN